MNTNILIWFFNPIVLVFWGYLIFIIYRKIFPLIRNSGYKMETYEDLQTLNRDIDCEYNPSIVSLLMNNELEVKDITADIMNLYAKKYLIVEKENEEIKIYENTEVTQKEKIFESDRYIINNIINKQGKFEFKIWRELVNNDYNLMGFFKEHKPMTLKTILISDLIIAIVSSIVLNLYLKNILFSIIFGIVISCLAIIVLIMLTGIHDNNKIIKMKLNENGKEEVKKWLKFHKFIKEYTLIKDKNIEDVILYEKYIPYAVALGVNKNYKDTIYSVFNQEEIENIIEQSQIDYREEYFG